MKKVLIALAIVLAFTGCKKEETPKFPADVQQVLNTIVGTWICQDDYNQETLTFTSFNEPTTIDPISEYVMGIQLFPMSFHGILNRDYEFLGEIEHEERYFYIDTSKRQIVTYLNKDGKYSVIVAKQYDYAIIDQNTMHLHDTELSLINTYTFKKQ